MPAAGPVILAPNHQSLCDPPAVGAAVQRPLFFMAKEELFRIPLLGWQIRHLNAFPVRRNSADRAALRHAEQLLAAGNAVVIFPEGYVSKTGEMQEFHSGVAWIALRTGAPVVPVYLDGTKGIISYGRLLPRRSARPVVVRFGPPLSLSDLAGRADRRTAIDEGATRIQAAVVSLAGEANHHLTAAAGAERRERGNP